MEMRNEAMAMRHSLKPKGDIPESEEYPGISEPGVELTKSKTPEVIKILEEEKEGTIMFLGGASEAIRTKSTERVIGDEAKRILEKEGREDIIVLTSKDAENANMEKGYKEFLNGFREFAEKIKDNPDKKVLIDAPLFLKEFALDPWMKNGEMRPYTKALLEKNGNNELEAVKDWISNEGVIGDLKGPNPTEMAENHIKGLERLKEFAEKIMPGRHIVVSMVGHSWSLDALITYLANDGKVDLEGFEKVGGKMIGETQIAKISLGVGKGKLTYGGKEFEI